jgi:hypothetical protein
MDNGLSSMERLESVSCLSADSMEMGSRENDARAESGDELFRLPGNAHDAPSPVW